MDNYKKPKEIVEYTINAGVGKANRSLISLLLLGFWGGAFIAFGAVGNILVGANLVYTDAGVAKFLGAAVFPVGLIMIVILGAELFTSNCLISMAVYDNKTTVAKMLRNWITVYIANFIGALFIAYLTIKTHSLSDSGLTYLANIAEHKVHAQALDIFLKGILCNMLVCGGVLLAYAAKDIAGKIFGIWFPIMLFIILGYDHCIANMLYLPAAIFSSANISVVDAIYNISFATLGNIVGGAIIMGGILYYTNVKDN